MLIIYECSELLEGLGNEETLRSLVEYYLYRQYQIDSGRHSLNRSEMAEYCCTYSEYFNASDLFMDLVKISMKNNLYHCLVEILNGDLYIKLNTGDHNAEVEDNYIRRNTDSGYNHRHDARILKVNRDRRGTTAHHMDIR